MPSVYLDHNATTPLHPAVLEAMMPYLTTHFGNASSIHWAGRAAARGVAAAREAVAHFLGAAPPEIVFTSGGSESDNLAIFGAIGPDLSGSPIECVTTTVEHPAVLEPFSTLEARGIRVRRIGVDRSGMLDLDALQGGIVPGRTRLVSVMFANNETGTIFPIERIAEIVKAAGALFHCDAVQAAGRIPIDLRKIPIDLLSLSAHKMYGPKGVGALFVRKGVKLAPLLRGGGQERKRRAGTENTAGIVGFGRACTLAAEEMTRESERLRGLTATFEAALRARIPGVAVNTHPTARLPNTLNVSFEGADGESLLFNLDLAGIAASSGSACSSGSLSPSHVLRAMGLPEGRVGSAIRFSLGRGNTLEEIEYTVARLEEIVARVRAVASSAEGGARETRPFEEVP